VMGLRRVEWEARSNGDSRGSVGSHAPISNGSICQEELAWDRRTLEWYERLNVALFRYLRSLGLPVEAAEDVLQETFLRLARHLKSGGGEDNIRSWVFQVAHNLSMDVHRANRRDRSEPGVERQVNEDAIDPTADPEAMYLEKEKVKGLREAMSKLTPKQCRSLLLRAEGLRYRDIASVLGVSEQRAIHLVKRGLLRLAAGL
jgi:RNA polymerase sigma-70 factor (ECF subfamily)